jgi:hypothetical protein
VVGVEKCARDAVKLVWKLNTSNTNAVRLGSLVVPEFFKKSTAKSATEGLFVHPAKGLPAYT